MRNLLADGSSVMVQRPRRRRCVLGSRAELNSSLYLISLLHSPLLMRKRLQGSSFRRCHSLLLSHLRGNVDSQHFIVSPRQVQRKQSWTRPDMDRAAAYHYVATCWELATSRDCATSCYPRHEPLYQTPRRRPEIPGRRLCPSSSEGSVM